MSWLYLPEQVAGCSPRSTSWAGERSATLRTDLTRSRCSRPESGMDSSMTPLSGATLERSTGDPGVDAWILSLRASRASRSVGQESGSSIETSAIAGPTRLASLTRYDRDTSSWRTYQLSVVLTDEMEATQPISGEFSATWPRAGMMRDGIVYPRRPLVPLTRGIGCGLWPTPTTDAANERKTRYAQGGASLSYAVKMWPTPTRGDSRGTRTSAKAKRLYSAGPTLLESVWGDRPGGKLNPLWVEWLMGWPIGWTDLRPLERGRFRKWLQEFGHC